jgi:hypothetical protein
MTELLESFMMGEVHSGEPKCPFCPAKKNEEHYRTYKGVDNDGGKLGDLVNESKKFATSIEADARPKNGDRGKDGRPNQSLIDKAEPLKNVKGADLDWKFQAHHAIPGNQCLANDPVEKFITASDIVKYDTGYSVNNPENGIWLPSFPEDENWPDRPAEKFAMAKIAMNKFQRQFHLGHHHIKTVDVDGIDTATDARYTDYVKGLLKDLHGVLFKWLVCPEEDEEKKHLGNPRIHDALDTISSHIIDKLKGKPDRWRFWVSRHARDYTIKTRTPNVKLDFEK